MHYQHVMDHSGHSTHPFDETNTVSVKEAEARFKELTGRGFVAAERFLSGTDRHHVKAFDPAAEDTLFIPQRAGG